MFGKLRDLHAGDALILALVLMILVTAAHLIRRPKICEPADPVRLAVGGVTFHVPAVLQPKQQGVGDQTPLSTEVFLDSDGRRRNRYCQPDADPPQRVGGFTLTEDVLKSYARRQNRFRSLEGVGLISVSGGGFPHLQGPFLDYELFHNPVGYRCLFIPAVSGVAYE